MDVGFTGSRQGMTDAQIIEVTNLLNNFLFSEPCSFHHGLCIGSDQQAADIAHHLGYKIIAHPGYLSTNPSWRGSRSNFDKNHQIMPEKPFLIRDHDIVDVSDVLIATPAQKNKVIRSGTWATIRYGIKTKNIVVIIYPDGERIIYAKS